MTTLIRASGFNSFTLHKYFIRSGVRKLETHTRTKRNLWWRKNFFETKYHV